MKSWWPLCLVNGLILAVVAIFAQAAWALWSDSVCIAYIESAFLVVMFLIVGNGQCLHRYHRDWLRDQARKRRAERGDYSEPYTWFQRDPNPEPLRNEEGF